MCKMDDEMKFVWWRGLVALAVAVALIVVSVKTGTW